MALTDPDMIRKNTGMERLVKMMKIGTLSSMLVNQNL